MIVGTLNIIKTEEIRTYRACKNQIQISKNRFLKKSLKMSIQKLGTCGVCGKNDAKYRCPKCETVSCSLVCSKSHKKLKKSCDGIRDKTKFVPIKNFSSMELVSGKNFILNSFIV